MNVTRTLEQAAMDAHRRGDDWATFWQMYAEQVRQVEPVNRQRYRKLVNRLLHLLTTGEASGQQPIDVGMLWGQAEPWLLDDDQAEPASPSDTSTAALCNWNALETSTQTN